MAVIALVMPACETSGSEPVPTVPPSSGVVEAGAPTPSAVSPTSPATAADRTQPATDQPLSLLAVNAIAPADAASDADSRYVETLAVHRDIAGCSGPTAVEQANQFKEMDDGRSFYFPDADRLRAEGFIRNDIGRDLARAGGPNPSPDPTTARPIPQASCTPGSDAMLELLSPLRSEWQQVIEDVRTSPDILVQEAETMSCLHQAGAPQEAVTDETAFLVWVDTQVFGSDTLRRSPARHWARVYADCGQGLFTAREDATLARRAEFLELHRAAVADLSQLLG